jgi:hypothetical protein
MEQELSDDGAHTPGIHIRNGTTAFNGVPRNDRLQQIELSTGATREGKSRGTVMRPELIAHRMNPNSGQSGESHLPSTQNSTLQPQRRSPTRGSNGSSSDVGARSGGDFRDTGSGHSVETLSGERAQVHDKGRQLR